MPREGSPRSCADGLDGLAPSSPLDTRDGATSTFLTEEAAHGSYLFASQVVALWPKPYLAAIPWVITKHSSGQ